MHTTHYRVIYRTILTLKSLILAQSAYTFQNSARWDLTTSITARFAAISPSSGRATAFSASDGCSAGSGEISDEVLMARIRDGDKEGLACLFHRYARLVRAVGYKILRDDSEADDLLQDVFLFIHQKSTVFDSSKSSARSWIVQMAYQRAIDRRRYLDSRHFYTQVDLEDVGNELSSLGTTVSNDTKTRLTKCSAGLDYARCLESSRRSSVKPWGFICSTVILLKRSL